MILFNFGVALSWQFCKLLVHLFFGKLREAEVQHAGSHGVHYLLDLMFAFYFMRINFTGYVAMHFVLNAMIECLHALACKRVEYVSAS